MGMSPKKEFILANHVLRFVVSFGFDGSILPFRNLPAWLLSLNTIIGWVPVFLCLRVLASGPYLLRVLDYGLKSQRKHLDRTKRLQSQVESGIKINKQSRVRIFPKLRI